MSKLKFFLLFLLIAVIGFGYWRYQRPLPQLQPQAVLANQPASQPLKINWPTYGQAAVGAVGYGVLDSHKATNPVPVASIAKVITALSVLKEKPLSMGQQGPVIIMTAADAKLYADYLAKNGSVVPVAAGEHVSQYQALQAMMLPSANNMADTMAKWAFGSMENYLDYANQLVQQLGMTQTTVADASGFSPKTVSTSKDLVLLGEAALNNPVLASIVSQKQAEFPGVGTIHNVNYLLGVDGILGIKTGNTDEAGGCYLFGAKRTIAGKPVIVVGAVLGAEQRLLAMEDSRGLLKIIDSGFALITSVQKNQVVGRYTMPWGGSAEAVSTSDIKQLAWKGRDLSVDTNLTPLRAPQTPGSDAGSIKTVSGPASSVRVILSQPIKEPSWTWRILH
jgi:D-alanyl-D-alanine carboxypeptidase (penicillin-binding protein 5/6)